MTAGRARVRSDDPLEGIELAVFDKDGTLIDFHLMWGEWVGSLAEAVEAATGLPLLPELQLEMGVDPASGRVLPHGLLAATPMARIRAHVADTLTAHGLSAAAAETALASAWHAPDPVALAQPVTDLAALFDALAARGCQVAVATSDDRDPTLRTLQALGVASRVRAVACADDGLAVKPAPDAVLRVCEEAGVSVDRTAMIGDSPADLLMARAARVRRAIGVLTGVGEVATLAPLADVVLESIAELAPAS